MPAPTQMYRPRLQTEVSRTVNPDSPQDTQKPSYYDVSILKPPVWKWQIATYFFLGGLSAGAYLLARVAERFGGREFKHVARIGTYTACVAAAPCPILLIWDLGDAARFHHMLRIMRLKSPMSLGTWVLTSITPIAYGAALREYAQSEGILARHPRLNVVAESIGVVADAAGIPLALLLGTYTGVLLSNTANPIWCQNKWITPLFAVGSFSTGVSAISLVHSIAKRNSRPTRAEKVMNMLDTIGHAAEFVAFEGYLHSLGPLKKPFTSGGQAKQAMTARAGMIASEVIKHLPVKGRMKRNLAILGTAMGLASAFAIRWAVVHGAHESANDPDAARHASRARDPALAAEYDRHERASLRAQHEPRLAPHNEAISTIDPRLKENPRHR
ncbi:MAG: NrfD/PsrC family molybdoenzyme membrane anchor subunit [Phycisphaerae bacterium]